MARFKTIIIVPECSCGKQHSITIEGDDPVALIAADDVHGAMNRDGLPHSVRAYDRARPMSAREVADAIVGCILQEHLKP